MMDQKAREIALKLVKYYQQRVLEGDKQWELGLETAKFWLKLVESSTPDPTEVEKLITILETNDEGSAWYEILISVKSWKEHLSK